MHSRMDVKPHLTSAALSIPRKLESKALMVGKKQANSRLYSRVLSRTLLSGQFEDRRKLAIPHKMTGS